MSQPDLTREMAFQLRTPRGAQRVAIIGMGAVGSAFAYALVHEGRVGEIVFIDIDSAKAEGELMDLSHCLPYGRPIKMRTGELEDARDCDIIVITAGAAQTPGQTRIELVHRNADIFHTLFPKLSEINPRAIYVIITNPVDVMTRLALNLSGLPRERVFGTGTTLDSARFSLLLANYFKIDPRNIQAKVIGEHGDSEVLVWSRASVGVHTIQEYSEKTGQVMSSKDRENITNGVKRAAYQIIERKGATSFAIGFSMLRVYEAIHYDQSRLLTVSRALSGAYGFDDLCLSLPSLITREGAQAPIEIELSSSEEEAFFKSAELVDNVYQQLKV